MNFKKKLIDFSLLIKDILDVKPIYLFWWTPDRADGLENYGDVLNLFLVKKLSNKKVVHVKNPDERKYKKYISHYFSIGSVLGMSNENSIIWGSGIISSDADVYLKEVLAVRGPRTRNRLLELGYKVPEVYGDPAILTPLFIENNTNPSYELGIIPHYVDYDEVLEQFKDEPKVKVIKLLTNDVVKTTNEILECKKIISSSLHGVILPHAYNIPALWIRISDKLAGDDIKFIDYFESVGIDAYKINSSLLSYENLMSLFDVDKSRNLPNIELLALRKKQLLVSCPFNNNTKL